VQNDNKGEDLDNLRPGAAIQLPFKTVRTTFRVDPDKGLSAAEVVAEISKLGQKSAVDSPIIQIDVGQPVRLISPLAAQDSGISKGACSAASQTAQSQGRAWPYDAALVARVLARNAFRAGELGQKISPVIVTVIDTGLDPSFVPEAMLSRDGALPGNPYGSSIIKNRSNPFSDHMPREERMHGSQVAAILTGASDLRDAILKSAEVQLKIFNVVQMLGNEYGVSADGVGNGMSWAKERSLIANVSIGSETELDGFLNALRAQRGMLAVVAAGNDKGSKLGDQISLYPAVYGGTGQAGDQVITVAAHDANLAPAGFSNRGKNYADILAPGCEVPFRSGQSGLYGTSFATPIVSMTAALLRTFGVGPMAPIVVKRRLEVSTDFDPRLEQIVLSSGRLNIAKALSVYDDTLERASFPLQFGRWQTKPDLDLCDNIKGDYKPIAVADIKKVSRVGSDAAPRIRIVHADREGKLVPDECSPAGNGLTFATLDDRGVLGEATVVPWKELIDVVPRYYRNIK
jgi:subtilisin family serine protease